MRRREFIAGLGGAAAFATSAVGQQANKRSGPARIGLLGQSSIAAQGDRVEELKRGLRDLGYMEGMDYIIEYRWAEGQYERLPKFAAELVDLDVDVIIVHASPGAFAAKNATTRIPIVMVSNGDALASGLISSLSRPGNNLTGTTFFQPELCVKRLEMLNQIIHGRRDVAVLMNADSPINKAVMAGIDVAALALGLSPHEFNVRHPAEFTDAFMSINERGIRALLLSDDNMLIVNSKPLAELALKYKIPSAGWNEFAEAGGLVGYGVDFPAMWRRAATFVHKILRGERNLPVEQSTTFRAIINSKTATALGLSVPELLLATADEVIE
jgi:putative tryptophan/tyrosine transport system substrate-binding protein